MPEDLRYIVKQGDCLSSIAEEYGYTWTFLWNHNAELKSKRKNPNTLLPGDVVLIPGKDPKNYSRAVDQRHRFRRKRSPAKLRLVLERYHKPLANKQYELIIDTQVFRGSTDGSGFLEVVIPPEATSGTLRVPSEHLECELQLGHLDPLEEISGVQARLENLGFLAGEITGELDDHTREALQVFQMTFGLDPTGELDDVTRQKLLERHDQQHAPLPEPPPPPADPPANDDSHLGVEDVATDPEADAREFERLRNVDE